MRIIVLLFILFSGMSEASDNPLSDNPLSDNPLSDNKVTCEEMEQFPEQVFELDDLGSGFGSQNEVDYRCPKSLSQLDFLQKIIGQANSIRSPSHLPQICTGSIVHAQWRYYHFALAQLGYYPQSTSSRASRKTEGMKYFEEWSYQSLHNRAIYQDYLAELEKARPLLIQWYINTYAVKPNVARSYTDNAFKLISNYGFGSYFYRWKPEGLVPFTDEAVLGNFDGFVSSIGTASDAQKENSLRRLLTVQASETVIKKLVSSIQKVSSLERSESIIANAVLSPNSIQLLIDAGYPVDQQNEFGKTALYYAIQFNQHESVKVLLNNGANVNHTYQEKQKDDWSCLGIERWGRTPLMHAAQHSDIAMLKLLLNAGADLHAKDIKDSSAADYATDNLKQKNAIFLHEQLDVKPVAKKTNGL